MAELNYYSVVLPNTALTLTNRTARDNIRNETADLLLLIW
jgi:hypothetical protein